MKKVIMIIAIMLCIISVQAKAFELEPTGIVLEILNTPGQINSGSSYLVNNKTNWTLKQINNEWMYNSFEYNVPQRMRQFQIWGQGWPGVTAGNVIEFSFAISWQGNDSNPIWLEPKWIDTLGASGTCQKVNQEVIAETGGQILWTHAKCLTTGALDHFELLVNWNHSNPNEVNDMYLYISKDIIFRPPSSEDEIVEIMNYTSTWNTHQIGWFVQNVTNGNIPIAPDVTIYSNSYEVLEEDLWDYKDYESWTNIGVNQDANTTSFIWTTATSILQSNTGLMGLMMSALGICLIRLVIG